MCLRTMSCDRHMIIVLSTVIVVCGAQIYTENKEIFQDLYDI